MIYIPLHEELVSNLSMILRSKKLSSTAKTCGFSSPFNPIVTADILRSISQETKIKNREEEETCNAEGSSITRAYIAKQEGLILGKKSNSSYF